MVSISQEDLEGKVAEAIESVLEEKIDWDWKFGTTIRKNKDKIIGNPRDTIDTRDTIDNLEVTITDNSIHIEFSNDDASDIFTWREEMGDIGSSRVVEEFAGEISTYVISNFFGK